MYLDYNSKTDFLEVFFWDEPENYYESRFDIDPNVKLYRSELTNQVVGIRFENLKSLVVIPSLLEYITGSKSADNYLSVLRED